MQTDEQKQQIVMDFAVNHQPKLFPTLAATDHNVNYFNAILEANWTAEFSIEWLTQAVKNFADKFEWLANTSPNAKPVLTKTQRLAEVGLSENDWRPERWDVKQKREADEKGKAKREYESNPARIAEAQHKAEEIARTATIGSHSDNASFRKLLSETFAYENTPTGKQLSWFRTLELRRDLYQQATNGSVR